MMTSLALASVVALAPAQAADLKLTNVRFTVGELGPERKVVKVLPGDVVFIGFDIDGLTITPDGKANYTMAMEVSDAKGGVVFKQDPRELNDFVPLRGNKLPARSFITVGLDQPAGGYACKVTVADPKTKGASSLSMKFEVGKPEFGIVGVFTSHDERGEHVAPCTGVVGQTIFMQYSVATFARDPKTKQPDVAFEYQIVDDKGEPVLGKPVVQVQDGKSARPVDEKQGAFGMQFPLFMSRPGKFTVKVSAHDRVANKRAAYDLPVTVLPAN